MVDTRARFHVPSVYGDEVTVESCVPGFRRSAFDVEHRLLKADGAVGVEGFETRVWTGRGAESDRIRSVPIPEESVPIPEEVVAAFA